MNPFDDFVRLGIVHTFCCGRACEVSVIGTIGLLSACYALPDSATESERQAANEAG